MIVETLLNRMRLSKRKQLTDFVANERCQQSKDRFDRSKKNQNKMNGVDGKKRSQNKSIDSKEVIQARKRKRSDYRMIFNVILQTVVVAVQIFSVGVRQLMALRRDYFGLRDWSKFLKKEVLPNIFENGKSLKPFEKKPSSV